MPAWVVPGCGLVLFFLLAWLVQKTEMVPAWDEAWALAMRDHAPQQPLVRGLLVFFTHVGDVGTMTILALAGAIWQLGRRQALVAAFWIITALGGAMLNQGVKEVIGRERPPLEWRDPAAMQNNESFPSGHAMGAIIGWGILGFVTLRQRSWGWRLGLGSLLTLLILLIGFSRIYLRAHWLSDVLAGFALGLAWLTLCMSILQKVEKRTS